MFVEDGNPVTNDFVGWTAEGNKAYDVLINIRTDSRKGDYSDKEQFVYSI